ncbi:vWA domain-containing protein [Granulosicoccus antarcticus]|uniref:VWFA domain-containing protein n=1 Tax=Granulosicoccus antarcticus IMCC3135 TaxID=1192854 RepID=A0A2Z2NPH2_9GAMM|nr:VWA domain-containing protein [Granulosicoccus antarcticus]ASJ71831.1 hypothetical protein IMCC3135_08665 [Granulosicoccus antarcticus IMCC3135]
MRPASGTGTVAGGGQSVRSKHKSGQRTMTTSRRIHWPRTLAAKRTARLGVEHLRFKQEAQGSDALHCVLLDCSASMMRGGQLALAKGILLALSKQLYRQRDRLAVIGFGGESVQMLQHAQRVSVSNVDWIEAIRGGGGSPVTAAVQQAERLLHSEKKQLGQPRTLWLLSDGRYDPLPPLPRHVDECHVVDFESGHLPLGRIRRLAELWHAQYTHASHWVDVNATLTPGRYTA